MIGNKIKGALFDLDGVLIDSESIYSIFWSDIDRQIGRASCRERV